MNSPMPTGTASSTLFSRRNSVNPVPDILGYQAPGKFLAKRTPRPRPHFVSASRSNQTCLQTSHAPRPGDSVSAQPDDVPLFRRCEVPFQHHQPVRAQNNTGQSQKIQESRPSAFSEPRPKNGEEDGILDRFLPYHLDGSASQHDPKFCRRDDQKDCIPRTLVIDLTQGDHDPAHDDACAPDVTSRKVVSKETNESSSRGAIIRRSNPQSVVLEDPFVDPTEAHPMTTTSLSDRKGTDPKIGIRTLRKPPRLIAEATKGLIGSSLDDEKCSRGRRGATGCRGVAGETAAKKVQRKIIFFDSHAKVVQDGVSGVSKSGEINTNGIRKHSHRSVGGSRLSKRARWSSHGTQHDQMDLDAAIYGQPGAAPPPSGVKIRQNPNETGCQNEQTRYNCANLTIHPTHNKSGALDTRKFSETESRGGRKFWFGNVSGRLRWSQVNKKVVRPQESDGREDPNEEHDGLQRRQDARPKFRSRALDFGDIPEEELPDYVQQNPAWLKACEFFRQTNQRREARFRVSERCEQETRDFF
ncbi:hypothetical protein E4U21_001402 [Claviceps maximensis]|nr:hypothetical protein E4U21_001402 [Claviceps maximensis]